MDLVVSNAATYSLSAQVENGLIGSSGSATLLGNTLNNTIVGAGGNDVLTGGAGNDFLSGAGGTDTCTQRHGDDHPGCLRCRHRPRLAGVSSLVAQAG